MSLENMKMELSVTIAVIGKNLSDLPDGCNLYVPFYRKRICVTLIKIQMGEFEREIILIPAVDTVQM